MLYKLLWMGLYYVPSATVGPKFRSSSLVGSETTKEHVLCPAICGPIQSITIVSVQITNQLTRSSSEQSSTKVSARYPCERVLFCHVCFIADRSNRSHLWCSASSFQTVKCAFYQVLKNDKLLQVLGDALIKSTTVEIHLQYSSYVSSYDKLGESYERTVIPLDQLSVPHLEEQGQLIADRHVTNSDQPITYEVLWYGVRSFRVIYP